MHIYGHLGSPVDLAKVVAAEDAVLTGLGGGKAGGEGGEAYVAAQLFFFFFFFFFFSIFD
jgi:hypothetical protein